MADMLLGDEADITSGNVHSSNKISKQASRIITHFSIKNSPHDKARTLVMPITADAAVANKLVSIVEIAKRELAKNGHKIYQYNVLASRTIDVKLKAVNGDSGTASDEDAFEAIKPILKKQTIPTMTIYICSAPIRRLKDAYGYAVALCKCTFADLCQ